MNYSYIKITTNNKINRLLSGCNVFLFCTFMGLFLSACDWRIYGDNVEQKKMSNALEQDLNKAKSDKIILFSGSINALPSYARECRDSKPVIPHKKCLFLAIEGKTIAEAQVDIAVIIRALGDQTQTANFVKYSNYHLVMLPLVRTPNYAGYVTPHSIETNFEIGQPVLIQIGK